MFWIGFGIGIVVGAVLTLLTVIAIIWLLGRGLG